MTDRTIRRPVYVLGAGFSKAIHSRMPVTDELGVALRARLAGEISLDLRAGQSFEEWLTLQATALPFLEGFENARRAADAARVIAEIARVLDERVSVAALDAPPLWLRQLVALWDAEQAVVLSFNYDTLIERAINGDPPSTISAEGFVHAVLGDSVVFPAPPAPPAQFMADFNVGTSDSLQVLKMHGSLTWFWSSHDPAGSTLIRIREKHVLGAREPLVSEQDFSGTTTLDRFLIPPVTGKADYYGSYLAATIWRTARETLAAASSLSLIGYSLPQEDTVTSELIAHVPSDAVVSVVNRDPGLPGEPGTVLANLALLGLGAVSVDAGDDSVSTFVGRKIAQAAGALSRATAFDELENTNSDVVVGISLNWEEPGGGLYVLAWDKREARFGVHQVGYSATHGANMPFRESVLNELPPGNRELSDFVTAERLRELLHARAQFTFAHPDGTQTLVGIAVARRRIERWEVLELKWAPAA